MDDKHLERWRAAKAAFLGATGREVQAFALIAIDETGEVYWGADYPDDPMMQRELLRKLDYMRDQLVTMRRPVSAGAA